MSSIVPPTFSLRRVSECDFKAKCGFVIKVSANRLLADRMSNTYSIMRFWPDMKSSRAPF